jgi:hypothetical protein
LFPVAAMAKVYKAIFLKGLRLLLQKNQLRITGIDTGEIIKEAGFKKWNVYAKRPFAGVAPVVEYLGRYTHKIAITAHRISSISEDRVTFTYKDYADGNKQKEMTLSITEFLRRFELHILPKQFVKIRHYGLLQNRGKTKRLNAIRQQLSLGPLSPKVQVPVGQRMLEKYGKDITLCPHCGKGKLVLLYTTYPQRNISVVRLQATGAGVLPPAVSNKASP